MKHALAALVLGAPAQAVPLLAAGLGRRPWALGAATGPALPELREALPFQSAFPVRP